MSDTYLIEQTHRSNGIGLAGFILALLGLILFWVPVGGWLLWILGLVFSFAGMFQSPRGFAIAGLVISFFDVIVLVVVIGIALI